MSNFQVAALIGGAAVLVNVPVWLAALRLVRRARADAERAAARSRRYAR